MPTNSITDASVTQSFNSLSGSDIRAYIGPYQFTELQGISYSVSREKAPIYTCGSADPRAFSRNKRGIAGSLVWMTFDRHALLNLYAQTDGRFAANIDDVRPEYQISGNTSSMVFNSSLVRSNGISVGATPDQLDIPVAQGQGPSWKEEARPWYSDHILPFDITLAGVNENGASAQSKIFGVEVLNEGYGISVDDAVSEMQASWIARAIEPLQAVISPTPNLYAHQ